MGRQNFMKSRITLPRNYYSSEGLPDAKHK
jgi:hypothetical protein